MQEARSKQACVDLKMNMNLSIEHPNIASQDKGSKKRKTQKHVKRPNKLYAKLFIEIECLDVNLVPKKKKKRSTPYPIHKT